MDEVILSTIKKLIGIESDLDVFDTDVIAYINTVFANLTQLGAGPVDGFIIEDGSEFWSDYSDDPILLSFVKTYIATKVKKMFDPPASAALLEAMKETISECEWRIIVHLESKPTAPAIEN